MGCCCCSGPKVDDALRAANSSTNQQLAHHYREKSKQQKLLLLGPGNSGKSTFFKQLLHINSNSYGDYGVTKQQLYTAIFQQLVYFCEMVLETDCKIDLGKLNDHSNNNNNLNAGGIGGHSITSSLFIHQSTRTQGKIGMTTSVTMSQMGTTSVDSLIKREITDRSDMFDTGPTATGSPLSDVNELSDNRNTHTTGGNNNRNNQPYLTNKHEYRITAFFPDGVGFDSDTEMISRVDSTLIAASSIENQMGPAVNTWGLPQCIVDVADFIRERASFVSEANLMKTESVNDQLQAALRHIQHATNASEDVLSTVKKSVDPFGTIGDTSLKTGATASQDDVGADAAATAKAGSSSVDSNASASNLVVIGELMSLKDIVKIWWLNPLTQRAFDYRNNLGVVDSTPYFLDRLDTLAEPDYVPNDQDILLVRTPTPGFHSALFTVTDEKTSNEYKFNLYDCGGQRSERRKWTRIFDDAIAIIYVASLSCYDQVLHEEGTRNGMTEAIELFDELVNNRWFRNTAVILFLNKVDLFDEKILRIPLTIWDEEYTLTHKVQAPPSMYSTRNTLDSTMVANADSSTRTTATKTNSKTLEPIPAAEPTPTLSPEPTATADEPDSLQISTSVKKSPTVTLNAVASESDADPQQQIKKSESTAAARLAEAEKLAVQIEEHSDDEEEDGGKDEMDGVIDDVEDIIVKVETTIVVDSVDAEEEEEDDDDDDDADDEEEEDKDGTDSKGDSGAKTKSKDTVKSQTSLSVQQTPVPSSSSKNDGVSTSEVILSDKKLTVSNDHTKNASSLSSGVSSQNSSASGIDTSSSEGKRMHAKLYLKEKFMELNGTKRPVFPHFTCATDRDNVLKVFLNIQSVIVTAAITRAHIF